MSLIKNNKSLVMAALMATMVFVMFSFVIFKPPKKPTPQETTFQYVSAKTNIKKGEKLTEDNIEIKNFPVNINGTYLAMGEIIGREAETDIEAGKPILKNFIKAIIIKEEKPKSVEPAYGYRAVPLLIKKSQLPPYITTDAKFDVFTKENTLKIENLKLLNILELSKDPNNKMLILEIKSDDVATFIKYQMGTNGFIFLQKNPKEYGLYNFIDIGKEKKLTEQNALFEIDPELPPIDKLPIKTLQSENKEVEIVIGNQKKKVNFSE